MVDAHDRSRSPFQLSFGHGLILVQMNLEYSQAQPYVIPLLKLFIWRASNKFLVFGVTSPEQIKIQDLLTFKRILYHRLYVESVNI